MKTLLLYHHLGLGDHIICHGIIREYCKQYHTTIFSKSHNYQSVKDMFCDISNLQILIGGDNFANSYILNNKNNFDKIMQIGFGDLNNTKSFEQQFYNLANINFNKKWTNFYVPENSKAYSIYKKLNLPIKYNFIHSDNNRGFNINLSLIKNKDYVFSTSNIQTNSIIDYIEIIKNANEIHVIDSAFMFLIDCLSYKSNQKLIIHRYARHNDQWLLPTLKKQWEIIN